MAFTPRPMPPAPPPPLITPRLVVNAVKPQEVKLEKNQVNARFMLVRPPDFPGSRDYATIIKQWGLYENAEHLVTRQERLQAFADWIIDCADPALLEHIRVMLNNRAKR